MSVKKRDKRLISVQLVENAILVSNKTVKKRFIGNATSNILQFVYRVECSAKQQQQCFISEEQMLRKVRTS